MQGLAAVADMWLTSLAGSGDMESRLAVRRGRAWLLGVWLADASEPDRMLLPRAG